MTLDDLESHERLVFAALVRLIVRADGEFSDEELQAMTALATEVGSRVFWQSMSEAQERLPGGKEVLDAALGVMRPEVRQWIYGTLVGLSALDGMDAAEGRLLDHIATAWDLT